MTTAARLGLPDLAFASLNDFIANGQMIANLDPSVPLIADADTGFGGPTAIARTVREYDRAGIAGLHIEDQVQTKRCGHLGGKQLVDMETWKMRMRAAILGREGIMGGSDIVIIARTDALSVVGFDEALKRVSCVQAEWLTLTTQLVAAKELGADMAFCEGLGKPDDIRKMVATLAPMPVSVMKHHEAVFDNSS